MRAAPDDPRVAEALTGLTGEDNGLVYLSERQTAGGNFALLALPGCEPAGKCHVTALVISDHVCENNRVARYPGGNR